MVIHFFNVMGSNLVEHIGKGTQVVQGQLGAAAFRLFLSTGGSLQDIAPTMLYLLGLPRPHEMTGRRLLSLSDKQRSVA